MSFVVATDTSASTGVAVNANASANTLGSKATLRSAGTHARCEAATIIIYPTVTSSGLHLLNFYQGASDTVVGTIPLSIQTLRPLKLTIPWAIPANVRVRADLQSGTGGRQLLVSIIGHEQSPFRCNGVETWTCNSVNTTNSTGYVSGTAGNNTFSGSSATLFGSTADDCDFMVIYGRDNAASSAANALLRVLDDGAVVGGNYMFPITNADSVQHSFPVWPASVIAAGSAITFETSANSATTNGSRWSALLFNLSASAGSLVATEADMQFDTRPLSGAGEILSVQLMGTDGLPITGKTYANVTCSLAVDGGAPSAQTLVDQPALGTYTSLGFKEQGALAPGRYSFCPATLPSSGKRAIYTFTGSGIRQAQLCVDLTGSDPRSASLTKEQIAIEALVTFLMGRGHKVEEVGTDIILYDTDGTTVLAQPPRTRSGVALNSVTSIGPD